MDNGHFVYDDFEAIRLLCLFNFFPERFRSIVDNSFATVHQFGDGGKQGVDASVRRKIQENGFAHITLSDILKETVLPE